jgi:ABC-type nitrate/sulfonate/bicarbonate transport system substrate-binding protein
MAAIKDKHEQIQGFITGWQRAVAAINAAPRSQRALMLDKIRIPPNVRDSFRIPPFVHQRVPTEAQWQDAMEWMQSRQLLAAPLPYQASVTDRFIRPTPSDRP